MNKPKFGVLWSNHPGTNTPCDSKRFPHQCAMKMGTCLYATSTAILASYQGACTYCDIRGHRGHVRSAEGLMTYLSSPRIWGPGEKYQDQKKARDSVHNRTGIIFFKDFYHVHGDKKDRPTGDHIDLWDGFRTKTGDQYFNAPQVWFIEIS